MSKPLAIDLFAEDRAHEELLKPLIERVAAERGRTVAVHVRSARGGHGEAIDEFRLYQRQVGRLRRRGTPDLVVVAIDTNCGSFTETRNAITKATRPGVRDRCVPACPDPHVERWYLADLKGFHRAVGATPSVPKGKCERDLYKRILAQAVVAAEHPATLGGIEFAHEIVEAMDLFRAGKSESSLKHFIDDLRAGLRRL